MSQLRTWWYTAVSSAIEVAVHRGGEFLFLSGIEVLSPTGDL